MKVEIVTAKSEMSEEFLNVLVLPGEMKNASKLAEFHFSHSTGHFAVHKRDIFIERGY